MTRASLREYAAVQREQYQTASWVEKHRLLDEIVALVGLDSDNGSEFINRSLLDYCRRHAITFTRSRAGKKNDSAHVEQKNGAVVRQLIGYGRFVIRAAYAQRGRVYRLARLHVNLTAKRRGRKPTPVDPRDRKLVELERQLAQMTGRAERAEAGCFSHGHMFTTCHCGFALTAASKTARHLAGPEPRRPVGSGPVAVVPTCSVYHSLSIVPLGALTPRGAVGLQQAVYRQRDAEHTVLHQVISEHLETFLNAVAEADDGAGLPQFVEREFREFLTCGVFEHGVAQFRCVDCEREHLVPFSCKRRGWCPSCGGRRMTERAAHLVDAVLPRVPVRQWVLTVPYRLRYGMAFDHGLSRAVLGVFTRVLLEAYARGARTRGIAGGRTGSITVIQRAGGGLNVNPHFHTLVLDGVFREAEAGALEFHPAPGPSDDEVAAILARIRALVGRLLQRRGLAPEDGAPGPVDRLGEESPVLAGLVSASVQGRVALGARAGRRVRRLGDEGTAEAVTSRGPRQAHVDGFDLHANVWVGATDRAGVERLCRYILRPPVAQERLRLRGDGRVALELKRGWHDGTRELVFEPLEFLERLAALTPRPETNLLLCHGLLASRARWRERVVAYDRGEGAPRPDGAGAGGPGSAGAQRPVPGWTWAALMHRAFGIDVLACPHCGGRLRLIATLHDPAVIRKILVEHLAPAHSGQSPGPAPPERGGAAS